MDLIGKAGKCAVCSEEAGQGGLGHRRVFRLLQVPLFCLPEGIVEVKKKRCTYTL